MSRIVEVGTRKYTEVLVTDEPGAGGACHEYIVIPSDRLDSPKSTAPIYATVHFQNGPIKDVGVNGCHQEDLLAIVIDRLRSFQAGSFACRENAFALTKCEEALHWLRHRTEDRKQRGVEGTNQQ